MCNKLNKHNFKEKTKAFMNKTSQKKKKVTYNIKKLMLTYVQRLVRN